MINTTPRQQQHQRQQIPLPTTNIQQQYLMFFLLYTYQKSPTLFQNGMNNVICHVGTLLSPIGRCYITVSGCMLADQLAVDGVLPKVISSTSSAQHGIPEWIWFDQCHLTHFILFMYYSSMFCCVFCSTQVQ